eukprot:269067-Hanusia_phi.AAC.1
MPGRLGLEDREPRSHGTVEPESGPRGRTVPLRGSGPAKQSQPLSAGPGARYRARVPEAQSHQAEAGSR